MRTMSKKRGRPSKDQHRATNMVRLPDDYHALMKELSRRNKRALTREVQVALDDYLRKNGMEPPADPAE
jgi:excinuclease UvrABC nuclease subunit